MMALAGLAATADAHRALGSLTTVEWNERSGKTEIVHRLHSHDAELGVSTLIDMPDLSVMALEGRARIALYVESRFRIASGDRELALDLIGSEVAGDYILVYQEWDGRLPDRIRVRSDILRDAFDEQINQVNFRDGLTARSLVFGGDAGWLDFAVAPPAADPR